MSSTEKKYSKGPFSISKQFESPFYSVESHNSEYYICMHSTEEDAKRIALCLNACRNLSNRQLEDDAVEKLREDRDLLLKAAGVVYGSKWIK